MTLINKMNDIRQLNSIFSKILLIILRLIKIMFLKAVKV